MTATWLKQNKCAPLCDVCTVSRARACMSAARGTEQETKEHLGYQGQGAAPGASDLPDLDFEEEEVEVEVEGEEESKEEPEGSPGALTDAVEARVEALDHVKATIQSNAYTDNAEEDHLLSVAALAIRIVYDHVAATLGVETSAAMSMVDARAMYIDQLQRRPYSDDQGNAVDPVEYFWPGARAQVDGLLHNLEPQLQAMTTEGDPNNINEHVPVQPHIIVGGDEAEPSSSHQRAASAPGYAKRRGTRAGRQRQERWHYRHWRNQIELLQCFLRPYLGHVPIPYTSWWDTPEQARQPIHDFSLEAATRRPDPVFWELTNTIPEIRHRCRRYGYHPSSHYIEGKWIVRKEAVQGPRQPPEPPAPRRVATSEAWATQSRKRKR